MWKARSLTQKEGLRLQWMLQEWLQTQKNTRSAFVAWSCRFELAIFCYLFSTLLAMFLDRDYSNNPVYARSTCFFFNAMFCFVVSKPTLTREHNWSLPKYSKNHIRRRTLNRLLQREGTCKLLGKAETLKWGTQKVDIQSKVQKYNARRT